MWVLLDRISIEGDQQSAQTCIAVSPVQRSTLHLSSAPAYTNRSIILSGLATFLRNPDLLRLFRATEIINDTFTPL